MHSRTSPLTNCYHCGSAEIVIRKEKRGRVIFRCRACKRSGVENPTSRHGKLLRKRGEIPSKGELVLKLRALADKLGRSPRIKDVREASLDGRGFTVATYRSVFGSFTAALDAANLERNTMKRWNREKILDEIRAYSAELGRPLEPRDLPEAAKKGVVAKKYKVIQVFGNLGNAIREAGVATPHRSRDSLLRAFADKVEEMGRHPTMPELLTFRKNGLIGLPTGREIRNIFHGYRSLKKLVKVSGEDKLTYSDDNLIDYLRELGISLGRAPRARDIDKVSSLGKAPSSGTYWNRFGSLNAALKLAGFKTRRNTISELEMVNELRDLYKKLERPLNYKDLEKAYADGLIASPITIGRRLGNLERVNNLASGKLVAP